MKCHKGDGALRLVCKITNNSGYGQMLWPLRLFFAKKIRPGIVSAGTWCRAGRLRRASSGTRGA